MQGNQGVDWVFVGGLALGVASLGLMAPAATTIFVR